MRRGEEKSNDRTPVIELLRGYESWPRIVAMLCVAPLTLSVLSGCAVLMGTADHDVAPTPAGTPFQARSSTPGVSRIGVCLDPSGSSNPDFAPAQRKMLAEMAAGWVLTTPLSDSGAPSIAGLELLVRQVQDNSFGDAPTLRVTVPGVAGLPPAPRIGSASFAEDDVAWQAAKQSYEAEVAIAKTAAEAAGAAVEGMPLLPSASEIEGCVSSLAMILQSDPRRFVIASDLDQNHAAQVAGSLSGAPVLIIQPCPSGDAQFCEGLASATAAALKARGATTVTTMRPEAVTATTYTTFGKEGT